MFKSEKNPTWPLGGHFVSHVAENLPVPTTNMHMVLEIEISKQTYVTLRELGRLSGLLQTDTGTDGCKM